MELRVTWLVVASCSAAFLGCGDGAGDDAETAESGVEDADVDADQGNDGDDEDLDADAEGNDAAGDAANSDSGTPDAETNPPDADESIPENSLDTGESCDDSAQCLGEAECVSGEYTSAYCAPLCNVDQDCRDEATGECGTCLVTSEFRFCNYYCGLGGTIAGCGFQAACPGDLTCDGAVCR